MVTAPPQQGGTTLTEAMEHYLRWHRVEGHTEATLASKRTELGGFIHWVESEGLPSDPTQITSLHILAHLEGCKRRNLAPQSIKSRFAAVRAWFNWMVEWGLLDEAPTSRIKTPRVPRQRKPFAPPETFQKLLDACDTTTPHGARRAAILWLLVTTGMRRGELCALEVEDLDWQNGKVRIRKGKGQKERWVGFSPPAQRAMRVYLAHRTDNLPNLWVTLSRGVRPLGYSMIGNDAVKLAKQAGVELQDPMHIWRRTWAAEAVKQHIPNAYIRASAGWTTNKMLDLYTAALEEEADALDVFKTFTPYK